MVSRKRVGPASRREMLMSGVGVKQKTFCSKLGPQLNYCTIVDCSSHLAMELSDPATQGGSNCKIEGIRL